MSKEQGKIVYQPPERCYTNVVIEETPHGYRIFRRGDNQPMAHIPFSAVRHIEYKKGD